MAHMLQTKFLFPMVSIGPFYGYRMSYFFPLDRLTKHMPNGTSILSIERKHFYNGKMYKNIRGNLKYDGAKWVDESGSFYTCESIYKDANKSNNIEFIETHVEMLSEGFFKNSIYFNPLSYALYTGQKSKTFFSDSQLKFGALRTIDQISAFGQWVEGYPDCNVSYSKKIDESVIIINPYPANAKITIQLSGNPAGNPDIIKNYMIQAQKGVVVSLSDIIQNKTETWSGQVIVKGKNRLILFFLKHKLNNINEITTLEHSENFRGEATYYNLSNTFLKVQQKLTNFFTKKIGGILKK